MMTINHRGNYVRDVIISQGFSISGVAKRLGLHRTSMTKRFQNEELDFKFIKQIGNVINYNFAADFPDMAATTPWLITDTDNQKIVELQKQLKFWLDEVYRVSMKNKELENELIGLKNNHSMAAEPFEKYGNKKGA